MDFGLRGVVDRDVLKVEHERCAGDARIDMGPQRGNQ
jgi:hypothetical protein